MHALWQGIVFAAYATLLQVATPLYLMRLWRRGRTEPMFRHALAERLGLYRGEMPQPGMVWLHAVSLGETRAARPLIECLRRGHPALRLLLTHNTAKGRRAGQLLLGPGDVQAWLPYDTPGATRRFLRRFRPAVGLLMDTELWPSLMRAAQAAQVPVVMANARLSARSAAKGQRARSLLRPAAERLAGAFAQTVDDAERLRTAGVRAVVVCGNLKLDVSPPAKLLALGVQWRQSLGRPVVLAASTCEGEEAELLAQWREVALPRPLLVVVPRHPQRFDEVEHLIHQAGFSVVRRKSWSGLPPQAANEADLWLGDSMRDMPVYYACADVALLGGSFGEFGGQNPVEAAACGCPVVMGPHTFGFAQAASNSLAARAALRVNDMREGVAAALKLVRDPGGRNAWVDRALGFAIAHRGAAQEMTGRILRLLPPAATGQADANGSPRAAQGKGAAPAR